MPRGPRRRRHDEHRGAKPQPKRSATVPVAAAGAARERWNTQTTSPPRTRSQFLARREDFTGSAAVCAEHQPQQVGRRGGLGFQRAPARFRGRCGWSSADSAALRLACGFAAAVGARIKSNRRPNARQAGPGDSLPGKEFYALSFVLAVSGATGAGTVASRRSMTFSTFTPSASAR